MRMAQNRCYGGGSPGRGFGRALLLLFALGIAGCHHKTTASYPPPPALAPPSSSEAAGARPTQSGAGYHGATSESPAAPLANAQLEPRGKPVSSEIGMASWYGPPYANRKAADGSIYDQNAMTAAHRELPMGSIVRVTNLTNNESVIVRITDRGPFIDGRIIDLSLAAAKAVDIYRPGTAKVRVEAYAPPVGSDPMGKWCVQIGAFLDQADAIQLKNDLMRRYATAKVIEFAGPTGHWVRINPQSADKATASQIADSIHIPDPGAQPYLVRLD
jgi:rare lipoprotein A